jgi:predicted nucleic acid-binding protein
MERYGHMTADERREIEDAAQAAVAVSVRQVPQSIYVSVEAIARERIPRDPDDWPTVALALVLEAGIWTHDADFLGCGVPTWTVETLTAHVRRQSSAVADNGEARERT